MSENEYIDGEPKKEMPHGNTTMKILLLKIDELQAIAQKMCETDKKVELSGMEIVKKALMGK